MSEFRFATKVLSLREIERGISLRIADSMGGSFCEDVQWHSDHVVRLRIYSGDAYPADDVALRLPPGAPGPVRMHRDSGHMHISSAQGYRIEIGLDDYSFAITDPDEAVVYAEKLDDVNPVGGGEDRVPPLGFSMDGDGGDCCVNLCAELGVYERIYGLGERFAQFDQRGQTVTMQNRDALGVRGQSAYKNVPFYVSSRGYGLFVNSDMMAQFHIGSRSVESINLHIPGGSAEIYILLGAPRQIVATYTALTGPAVLPPDWSFGTWVSNAFMESSQREIERDAREMRARHIPCDVIHLDCYWLRKDMWCDFEWDDRAFPDHGALIRLLHQQHYRVCVWINPYVTVVAPMYREGAEQGYFVRDGRGAPYHADLWHGLLPLCAMVDFTNPDAKAWYQAKVCGLLRQGIDAVKTDFGEDVPLDARFHNGKTGAQMRNRYAGLYNEAVMECTVHEKPAGEAVVWARSGTIGMQRYPVCWSGDPRSSYGSMAAVLRGGLSLGVSGVPFWSHDIGGFYGEVDPQVFVRWAQFGLLCSHSRFHGTTSRQIWAHGEEAECIVTDFIRLRYRLMPYILRTARECVRDHLPFIRPMWMGEGAREAAWPIWDQFYMGDDIIVAPVFGPRDAVRSVYIPDGKWTDFFTGIEYQGPQTAAFHCPLDRIPLLMRSGAQIPLSATALEHLS